MCVKKLHLFVISDAKMYLNLSKNNAKVFKILINYE